MRVKVSFLGFFRNQLGRPSLEVELADGSTYRDLLNAIAPNVEGQLPEWAWDATNRIFTRRVLVSRNLQGDLRDEATVLADGDEIVVVPPLAGG
ncbi:MAG: MoaD/ThiS family protein [Thermoleophilia bacterium]|nr:MoaD/ThiS family protein [Thermoleophilia bacterium]